jgi:biopolymer transport protein ExbD
MNQVNPLHIVALLIVIITFLFFKLSGVKDELREAKSSYKDSEKLAVELSGLKDVYADKKRVKRSLDRILSVSSLKSANLDIKRDRSFIRISSKSMDIRALNYLMGKILNGSYNIVKLKIKRLSDEKASLNLEIKW